MNHRRPFSLCWACWALGLFIVLVWLAAGPVSAQADGDAVLGQIRAVTLQPERAVEVRDLVIDLALGELDLEQGILIPASPVAGRTFELVFLGQAWFRITPPDALEAAQLERFTDQDALATSVDRAVLTIGSAAVVERLLGRAALPAVDDARLATANEALVAWIASPERKGIGSDAAIFKSAFGDAAYQGYFTAVCDSEELGRFFYIFDPSEIEQVTLGQFVPFELDDRDRYRAEREIRRAQKRGRSMQARLEDIGDWDTWVQSSQRDGDRRLPGSAGFEPQRYILDATVDPADQRITGKAKIEMTADTSGRRALTLELFADLEVHAVRDGQGRDLQWFRAGDDLNVILAEPVAAGEAAVVEVGYRGVILDRLESGIFAMRDTYAWYPHVGSVDRARYEVTLRTPKKLGVLASGSLVRETTEDGQRVQQRVLDLPAFAFSFEVGDFEMFEEQVGHVKLTVGISKSSLSMDSGVKDETVGTIKDALLFYEEQFGAYPLDHLTVATIPRGYSQGFISFVTLSHYLLALPRGMWVVQNPDFSRADQRRATIAHEVSHQWWGNRVGWYNYRDQWLSEALADFSSVIFTAKRADKSAVYMNRHAAGWQGSINRFTVDGRPLESLGPVVMGTRLISSQSRSAYQAIVYDKGAVVFSMLARSLGEEALIGMLRSLAEAVEHRAIDTATFIRALERMSGVNLEGFAQQFIYGTGVPEVYYTYGFTPAGDGQWRIEGEARQVAPIMYRFKVHQTEEGGWRVSREHAGNVDISNWALVVPFQVVLADSDSPAPGKNKPGQSRFTTGRGLGGNLVLQGETSSFGFTVKEKPRDLWLDQSGQVLARFYSENREPKIMLRYRADRAEPAEQEVLLGAALRAPLVSEEVQARSKLSDKELERRARLEDALIHLLLARLHLDQGRQGEAREVLQQAEALFDRFDTHSHAALRATLKVRLNILDRSYQEAYDSLAKRLRLSFPVRDDDTTSDRIRRNRWRRGQRGTAEEYSLLAIAAFETGHIEVSRRAAEEAEERGADVTALLDRLGEG